MAGYQKKLTLLFSTKTIKIGKSDLGWFSIEPKSQKIDYAYGEKFWTNAQQAKKVFQHSSNLNTIIIEEFEKETIRIERKDISK